VEFNEKGKNVPTPYFQMVYPSLEQMQKMGKEKINPNTDIINRAFQRSTIDTLFKIPYVRTTSKPVVNYYLYSAAAAAASRPPV
jgi:hypothetical protein